MTYEPELGQAVFGNPYGERECPEWFEALLRSIGDEIWRVTQNCTGNAIRPTSNEASEFVCDTFEMRSYYWGECECGWEAKEFPEPHDDTCYQVELKARFIEAGVYWEQERSMSYDDKRNLQERIYKELTRKYRLPMQGCAVHCTCTYPERGQRWFDIEKLGPEGHAVTCRTWLPNFQQGDLQVRWYKYLGRGMSTNREITHSDGIAIFESCMAALTEWERANTPEHLREILS